MRRENVRISDNGQRLLDNNQLAQKVADAILEGQRDLAEGKVLLVDGLAIRLVTTMEAKEQ